MKKFLFLSFALVLVFAANATAGLVELGEGSFTPAASTITFSEYPLYTVNPVYNFGTYTVTFDGKFVGGLGTPTGPTLALDAASGDTFITTDSANPTSPVLSGTPLFAGSIAILFSQDVAAVGLDGGYFDSIGATTIAAFDRAGNLIGSIVNQSYGIEFFGLGDDSGLAKIAGIQFYITGNEPAGYAIDNLTYAFDRGGYTVPEASFTLLLGMGLGLVGLGRKMFV